MPERSTAEPRATTLERLDGGRFEVLVIGGGIVGAGIAALAAADGVSVALVERGDFASGTSSASSKLIHGGLRYLRMGDVRLVREALLESRALTSVVAPHLVRPLRFLLPVYDDGPYGRAAIRTALWLYRALAGSHERIQLIDPDEAVAVVPSLRRERLRGAGVYHDAQTNDARLCLACIRAAADGGAAVLPRAEAVAIERGGSGPFSVTVQDDLGGSTVHVRADALVNATGPWVDRVRALENPAARPSVVLSKGIHLVVPQPPGWSAALTIPLDRTRVSFAVPWEGVLLLGTTDEHYDGDPDDLDVAADDERQVLAEASWALADVPAADGRVLARFAGLRVLPVARRGTAVARRETSIQRGPKGMITVAGGKLTTHRRIALSVLDELRADFGGRKVDRVAVPLPGAGDPATIAASLRRSYDLETDSALLLARTYGTLAAEVMSYAGETPEALAPLVQGEPELAAQVWYARDREWALTPDDVLRRRTTLALRGLDTADTRERVESLLGR